MSARRICKRRDCITVLAATNPGPWCWTHTPDLTQTDFRLTRKPTVRAKPREVMSSRFLEGIPGTYTMSPDERVAWIDSVMTDLEQE